MRIARKSLEVRKTLCYSLESPYSHWKGRGDEEPLTDVKLGRVHKERTLCKRNVACLSREGAVGNAERASK